MNRKLCMVLAVLLSLSILMSACESKNGPEKTLDKFVTSFNKMDMDGMIDCMDPTTAERIRAMKE